MRILLASMPLLALVAIFSSSAIKHIDHVAMANANVNQKALPECVEILDRVQIKKAQMASQSSRKSND